MDKKLSVIIPVYNVQNTIYKSLESICKQTYKNLEIILIDDGSTDCSGSICRELANQDSRIIFIEKNNGGVSSARNKGLECATGEYITFFDPDDILSSDTYEILLKQMHDKDADIIVGGFVRVVNGKTIKILQKANQLIMDSQEAIETMLRGKIFRGEVWDKIYRRNLIKNARFNIEISHAEDLLFNFNIFRRANKIIFAPVYGYRYYVRSTSETSNFTLGTLTYIKALRQMLHEPRINGEIDSLLYGRYGTALASCIFKMIMSKNSKFEVYIKEYRRSLRSIGLKALGKSGLSLRQKCGIVYVLLPMTVCKLLTWIAKKFQRNL